MWIELWDENLEKYKAVADTGFATIEYIESDDEVDPDGYEFEWAASEHLWRLNGKDELAITLATIQYSVEMALPPFVNMKKGCTFDLSNYDKVILLVDGRMDELDDRIFGIKFMLEMMGSELEIVDVNRSLTFSQDCDFVMHVEDFDECDDKLEVVYDLVKHLELA